MLSIHKNYSTYFILLCFVLCGLGQVLAADGTGATVDSRDYDVDRYFLGTVFCMTGIFLMVFGRKLYDKALIVVTILFGMIGFHATLLVSGCYKLMKEHIVNEALRKWLVIPSLFLLAGLGFGWLVYRYPKIGILIFGLRTGYILFYIFEGPLTYFIPSYSKVDTDKPGGLIHALVQGVFVIVFTAIVYKADDFIIIVCCALCGAGLFCEGINRIFDLKINLGIVTSSEALKSISESGFSDIRFFDSTSPANLGIPALFIVLTLLSCVTQYHYNKDDPENQLEANLYHSGNTGYINSGKRY